MRFRKPPSQKERERIESQVYQQRMREDRAQSVLPDPRPDPPACEKHPSWKPSRRLFGAPRPPSHMCPYCKREAQDEAVGPEVWIRAEGIAEVPALTRRATLAIHRHNERLERAGIVVPGSEHERKVLEDIEEFREQYQAREAGKTGRRGTPAWQRIENGELVSYVNVSKSIRQPARIVRVAP